MNPFQQMANVLGARPAPEAATEPARTPRKQRANKAHNGNTAKVRAFIRSGPCTAKEITQACGLSNSGMVMALIRHDVARGVIVKRDRKYRWAA